ncbi:MAG TPA: class II aldolase/adducin family protein [Usitatibacter sp.]|jgi:HCOMODA/2-hydroxy-3-carboxy-muconic semialdehyde decarboxylase|nr:class II aldolase/adducin family protein [Usitatibacter sp.]
MHSELLVNLVAANRILAMEGVLDGYGHVSVRSEKSPAHFFMSRSVAPQLVKVADVMEHGADSEPVDDERRPYLERFLHGEIYRQRPDVTAIVHSHSEAVIPFGITKAALRPVYHMASFLWSGVPVFEIRDTQQENDLLIRDARLGRDLAKCMGACTCVMMRGHGMTVVGSSLPEAVFRAIYTQANARMQSLASQLPGPIEFLSDEEGRRATETNRGTVERPWELWKAKAMTDGA